MAHFLDKQKQQFILDSKLLEESIDNKNELLHNNLKEDFSNLQKFNLKYKNDFLLYKAEVEEYKKTQKALINTLNLDNIKLKHDIHELYNLLIENTKENEAKYKSLYIKLITGISILCGILIIYKLF